MLCCVSASHTKTKLPQLVLWWSTLLVKVLNRPPRLLTLLKSGRITGLVHQQESECMGRCYQQCWKEARLLSGSTLVSNGPPRSLFSKAWHGSSCLNSSLKDCQVSKASDVLSNSKHRLHSPHTTLVLVEITSESLKLTLAWVADINNDRHWG